MTKLDPSFGYAAGAGLDKNFMTKLYKCLTDALNSNRKAFEDEVVPESSTQRATTVPEIVEPLKMHTVAKHSEVTTLPSAKVESSTRV